ILFYVSIGFKNGAATIPILEGGHGEPIENIAAASYFNPVPHVLMLTAIVVGVATVGVALAVIQRLYAEYGTLEENEILDKIANS
ncbi:MAG: NADH-quinone oxidoreductase subunit K, partial [Candidatus Eremiobacteraeota bacterium]|nr:NADH-quinone oxidoreductase subunit K [Candidatus Eremiobacteraeota bacterium]